MKKPSSQRAAGDEPSEEAIRDYAYHLFLQGGQVPGRDFDNWMEAKACLKAHIPLKRAHARLHAHVNREIIDVSAVPSLEARNMADEVRL